MKCRLLGCEKQTEYNDFCSKKHRFIDDHRYTGEDLQEYLIRVKNRKLVKISAK